MSVYWLIILAIIIAPLLLATLPPFRLGKKWFSMIRAIGLVSPLFIVWDIVVTARGDWHFNPAYVRSGTFFNLPWEEVLFFVVVPFACLFLYEGFIKYIPDRKVPYQKKIYLLVAGLALLGTVLLDDLNYTATVLWATTFVLLLAATRWQGLFSSLNYWRWLGASTLLFMFFNYFLTSLPVVVYNPLAITNFRFLTIPIEDFLYNFCLLTAYAGIYNSPPNPLSLRFQRRELPLKGGA